MHYTSRWLFFTVVFTCTAASQSFHAGVSFCRVDYTYKLPAPYGGEYASRSIAAFEGGVGYEVVLHSDVHLLCDASFVADRAVATIPALGETFRMVDASFRANCIDLNLLPLYQFRFGSSRAYLFAGPQAEYLMPLSGQGDPKLLAGGTAGIGFEAGLWAGASVGGEVRLHPFKETVGETAYVQTTKNPSTEFCLVVNLQRW